MDQTMLNVQLVCERQLPVSHPPHLPASRVPISGDDRLAEPLLAGGHLITSHKNRIESSSQPLILCLNKVDSK